jgi:dipeptidase D
VASQLAGLNIADGRGNAVQLLAATVAALMDSDPEMQLISIKGGDKRNALPREASAVLAVGCRLWALSM